jgi:hypothetical protein
VDAATKLAISKFVDDEARDQVEPGTYDIDKVVRFKGGMVVSEDPKPRSPTVMIPWMEVFALSLHRAGVTRDKTLQLVAETVKDCLENKDSAVGCIKESFPEIQLMIERIKKEVVEQLPKQATRGAVKVSLVVEEVVPTNGGIVDEANQILKDLGFAS